MLEFFRRLRGPILIGITVIIVISFSWWGGSRKGLGAGQREAHDVAFTLYGRDYTHHELDKLGRLQALSYSRLGLFEFAFGLPAAAEQIKSMERGGPSYDFAGNLLVLREQALEYGVAASDADAKKRMETLQPFQKDGKFDENTAAEQVAQLNMFGFSNQDLLDLMKDVIAYERLQELIGSNYSPSPLAVTKAYADAHQTVKATAVTFAIEDFKKKAEVKDDEIAKYFEEKKDSYMTSEKRAASYVLFEKPKTDDPKKVAEENAKAQTEYELMVNDFDSRFKDPKADFTALVAEFQKKNAALKMQTIAAFEQAAPPEALKDEAAVVKEVFRDTLAVGQHSDAIQGSKGFYFLTVTKVDEPKQQELKDVKDKVKETLITQKAQEAIMKAANEARTAVIDGLKAGKKLDALAKDKGLKIESLPEFTPSNPPPDNKLVGQIAKEAGATAVQSATKPVANDTGAVFAVVTAKELYKSDQSATMKESELTSQSNSAKQELFKAWFSKKRSAANMQVAQN